MVILQVGTIKLGQLGIVCLDEEVDASKGLSAIVSLRKLLFRLITSFFESFLEVLVLLASYLENSKWSMSK